jgi:hypothetical protein
MNEFSDFMSFGGASLRLRIEYCVHSKAFASISYSSMFESMRTLFGFSIKPSSYWSENTVSIHGTNSGVIIP